MKVLGVVQFQQMKFKTLPVEGKWKATLGNIPEAFMAIIYGRSGNGKTEFCIQLAKMLAQFDKVAWLSYEQGHGFDLQTAILRNNMNEVNGNFLVIDPTYGLQPNVSLFESLDNYLSKRNSPKFIFIDSLDYTQFTKAQYFSLKEKYGKKKCFIWISHEENGKPETKVGQKIEYDGGIGIFVNKFIARVNKNRFGGFEDYIIYEKRARELNPKYFELKAMESNPEPIKPEKTKTKRHKKSEDHV